MKGKKMESWKAESLFREELDESNERIDLLGVKYFMSDILKQMDINKYRQLYFNWISDNGIEIE